MLPVVIDLERRDETGVLLYKTGNSMCIKIIILLSWQMYDCHQSISDVKVHNRKGCHIQILAGLMTLPALSC